MTSADSVALSEESIDTIADGLNDAGYIIISNALSAELLNPLQNRVLKLSDRNWQQAGIGRSSSFQKNSDIRSDSLYWISTDNPIEAAYLQAMEELRSGLNRRLYMGLFDYESHFATYPKGAYYQKHVDALKGKSNRIVSTILYLNNIWQKKDGGELLLYSEQGDSVIETVKPELGTMVFFLSEKFPHEVLKASRQRYSLTGWFRVNGSESGRVDPPN